MRLIAYKFEAVGVISPGREAVSVIDIIEPSADGKDTVSGHFVFYGSSPEDAYERGCRWIEQQRQEEATKAANLAAGAQKTAAKRRENDGE